MNGYAIEKLRDIMQKEAFQSMYGQAVQKMTQFACEAAATLQEQLGREIVSGITGRIKSPESIVRKLEHKEYPPTLEYAVTKLNDLAGIRITCYFLDDVEFMAGLIRKNINIRFLKEKDYIRKPKSSGYKSLHLIVEVPVENEQETHWIKTEIQIRTIAMDFWARLDHRLCYKKELKEAQTVKHELKEYADIISTVDKQMLILREKIDAIH